MIRYERHANSQTTSMIQHVHPPWFHLTQWDSRASSACKQPQNRQVMYNQHVSVHASGRVAPWRICNRRNWSQWRLRHWSRQLCSCRCPRCDRTSARNARNKGIEWTCEMEFYGISGWYVSSSSWTPSDIFAILISLIKCEDKRWQNPLLPSSHSRGD